LLRALSARRRTSPEPLRLRRGAITSLGMCHSWVTKTRGTVEASGVTIGFSMKVTPLSSRNWKVGTHSSANMRTEIAVVVAAVTASVIDPIGKNLVGAVLDVELFLQGVAAAEMDPAAAQHGVPADVEILLDDDHRGAVVARRYAAARPAAPAPMTTTSVERFHSIRDCLGRELLVRAAS
jgi:hypothetical protein